MERCPGTVGGDYLRGLAKVLIRSPGVILNHATGILVLFPSTLVAGIWTLHGVRSWSPDSVDQRMLPAAPSCSSQCLSAGSALSPPGVSTMRC